MSTADKLTYLNTTKTKIREGLNSLGADLDTEDTFRSYVDAIDEIYQDYPKITGEGESLSLDNTKQASMEIDYKGNTSQDGAPTPTSPIPVNVVSGDNTIKVEGKNLLNVNNIYSSTSTINLQRSYENGIVTLIWSAGFNFYMTQDNSQTTPLNILDSSKTYTISFYHKGNALNLRFDESNNNIVTTANDSDYTKYSYTFTGLSELVIKFVRSDNTGTAYLKDFQIEAGSTATTYEPYIGQDYPIYLGVENLANVTITGQVPSLTNGALVSLGGSACTDYIIIDNSKEYTFSYSINNTANPYIAFYGENDSYLGYSQVNNSGYKLSSSTHFSTAKKIRLRFDQYDRYYNIQLEKGTKANHYTPYGTTPIELCKIGTYQDYIYKEDGSWYLHKEIGKVVLNGSESGWGTQAGASGFYRYYATINTLNLSSTLQNEIIVKSNYFRGIAFIYRNTDTNETIYVPTNNGTQYYLYFNTNIETTLDNFKTWLSTHNTIVYYVLNTPINTLITDTTLINQLEESKLSYISQTNISQVNNDLPFNLDVKALRGE